jgi:Rps23 Pro-64 3,4-dihydroxylase Tpa1-like proline 4-hydroxylase
LSQSDFADTAQSAQTLAAHVPAPHHLVPGFLGESAVEQLLNYCIGNEDAFSAASVGDGKQTTIDGQLRRSRSLARPDNFIYAVHAEFRRRLATLLPEIILALKLSPFEPTVYEMELVAHNDGAFFARHIDTFTGIADLPPTQRIISAVYYFFASPKRFSGGELRLFPVLGSGVGGRWLDVEPVRDSLVCFPSFAPHEVLPISCPSGEFGDSRFAINTWICRDNPASTNRENQARAMPRLGRGNE